MILNQSNQRNGIVSIFLALILVCVFTLGDLELAIASPQICSKEQMGAWTIIPMAEPENRMQSVHTIVLPNGKVLMVNGSSFRSTLIKENGKFSFVEPIDLGNYDIVNNASLFDPETQGFEKIDSPLQIQYGETNDLFCSGHLQLPNGNVLFVSGTGRYYPGGAFTGSKQLNLYDWRTNQWSPLGQLQEGRWYTSLIPLADGKVVIFSGLKQGTPNQINPSIEIYDSTTNKLQYIDIRNIKDSPFNTKVECSKSSNYDTIDLYPRIFPIADGRLLITGDEAGIAGVLVPHNSKRSYLMSIHEDNQGELSVSFELGPERQETSKAYGTAVQVPNSEDILLLGGILKTNSINFGRGGTTEGFPGASVATSLQHWVSPEKSGAENGIWEIEPNFLDKPRANLQAVILPTKELLIINGGEYPEYKPIYEPLLMTPDPNAKGGYQTKSMNPAKLPRLYHNGAVLLPDGRVLVVGGNANRAARENNGTVHVDIMRDNDQNFILSTGRLRSKSGDTLEFDIDKYYENPQVYFEQGDTEPFIPAEIWQGEIFSPPYLFKRGTRPKILNAPKKLKYSQSEIISVESATENSSLVLVKLGSVTHSFDYGQRLAELLIENVTVGDGGQYLIKFKAPENPNLYPPGYYMMFYLNDLGKPSCAKIIKLEA